MPGDEIVYVFFSSALIILVMVTLIVVFMIRYQRKLLAQQDALNQVQLDHAHEMQQAILDGEEKVKASIASELHDNLGSLLAAVRLKILRSEKTGVLLPDDASDLGTMLEASVATVRNISHELLPVTLRSFGLLAAIRELGNIVSEHGELEVKVDSDGVEKELSNQDALMVYRIIQELFNNALRHSKASAINWNLRWEPTELHISYQDNGVGFNTEVVRNGLGFHNMTTRATLLGASFDWQSEPGKGVTAELIIPQRADGNS